MSDEVELLRHLYRRFNSRDIAAVLRAMHEDIIWANGMEGGHVRGRDGVLGYWKRQWTIINPHVDPIGFSPMATGEVIVEVHQIVRDLNDNLLSDRVVGHIFQIEDGLIKRFDIRS
jgi:hypothetical protein